MPKAENERTGSCRRPSSIHPSIHISFSDAEHCDPTNSSAPGHRDDDSSQAHSDMLGSRPHAVTTVPASGAAEISKAGFLPLEDGRTSNAPDQRCSRQTRTTLCCVGGSC